MRWILAFIVLAGLGFIIYGHFAKSGKAPPQESTTQKEVSATPSALAESPPPPAPGEEEKLREAVKDQEGPQGDPERLRLGQLLLGKDDPQEVAQGRKLLQQVFEGGGELAPRAAALLLTHSDGGEGQLRYASYIEKKGAEAPGYAKACLTLGKQSLQKNEDPAQVEAWRLLSAAYFSVDDPKWRASIRPDLQKLVNDLILSPRITKACPTHTVQAGDTLVNIAKQYGTTVDLLRGINRLEGDLIHPGERLKVLSGTVTLEVDKSDFRLDARLDGRFLFSAPVGLGEYGKTPVGTFVIDQRQEKPDWWPVGQQKIPYGSPDNPLGERWLGFKKTENLSGYGIHGTSDPSSIGKECSKGCIRMKNEDVVILYRLVPLGTKVTIRD